MKKLIFYLVVFFSFIAIGYKSFFYFDGAAEKVQMEQNNTTLRLTKAEYKRIKEGDFILRRGFGFFSDIISKRLNKGTIDVTHAGIIVIRGGHLHVIHSLSSDVSPIDGMQIQALNDFLRHSAPGTIIVTRAKGANADLGSTIAKLAEGYLSKKIPFDHHGLIDNDEELFCTELIWKILEKDLNHVVLPATKEDRKNFFYSMDPMYDSKFFDIKINQYKK